LEEHRNTRSISLKQRADQTSLAGACVSAVGSATFRFRFRETTMARGNAHLLSLSCDSRGLDMAIINAGQLAVYEEIEPEHAGTR